MKNCREMKKIIITLVMVTLTIAGLFASNNNGSTAVSLQNNEPLAAKVIRNAGDKLNIRSHVKNDNKGINQIHAILSNKSSVAILNLNGSGNQVKAVSRGNVQ